MLENNIQEEMRQSHSENNREVRTQKERVENKFHLLIPRVNSRGFESHCPFF